ncbi:hypothetical protein E3T28_09370 [Cryobacterium sinapicolor]|uniref:SipW-cognate class signal peptide n=1 Tax=Cryobacterium sinapicolor TaxID=1259236 RepID=A0ABY2J1Z9_9MICO|nr:hypothetical protein [Cryobacterium sinapicolor]TFC98961.1 hypothetical protein E3T28_09370 [Cryobacterium sinapicolor]
MNKKTTPVATAGTVKQRRVRSIALVATAMLLVGSGGAYAYWSTTGSGSGKATNGPSNGSLVLIAHLADGLTPGASVPVTYSATNAGTSSLRVGTIAQTGTTNAPGCDFADNFTIASTVSSNTRVMGTPANQTAVNETVAGTSTLMFLDTAENQDACKGAIVTLDLTSN